MALDPRDAIDSPQNPTETVTAGPCTGAALPATRHRQSALTATPARSRPDIDPADRADSGLDTPPRPWPGAEHHTAGRAKPHCRPCLAPCIHIAIAARAGLAIAFDHHRPPPPLAAGRHAQIPIAVRRSANRHQSLRCHAHPGHRLPLQTHGCLRRFAVDPAAYIMRRIHPADHRQRPPRQRFDAPRRAGTRLPAAQHGTRRRAAAASRVTKQRIGVSRPSPVQPPPLARPRPRLRRRNRRLEQPFGVRRSPPPTALRPALPSRSPVTRVAKCVPASASLPAAVSPPAAPTQLYHLRGQRETRLCAARSGVLCLHQSAATPAPAVPAMEVACPAPRVSPHRQARADGAIPPPLPRAPPPMSAAAPPAAPRHIALQAPARALQTTPLSGRSPPQTPAMAFRNPHSRGAGTWKAMRRFVPRRRRAGAQPPA